jgi:hypothetical protein
MGYFWPMAEQEIIKHGKAIYDLSKDRGRKWRHKFKEVLSEILIIVFAVSVSIWFHNWSESWKDRSEEKEFYIGLKKDLLADLGEMHGDRDGYKQELVGVAYFESVGRGGAFALDSFDRYYGLIFGNTQIAPRISRFEALKGSGRLDILRNKDLLIDISDLYQKDFPHVAMVNEYFNNWRQHSIFPFVIDHLVLDSTGNGTNWPAVLRTPQMRMLIHQEEGMKDCADAYTLVIDKAELIIREIDKELK